MYLSLRRRFLFGSAVVLGLALLAECGAFAAFWVLDGRPFTYSRLAAERRELADTHLTKALAEPLRELLPERFANEALHPYLGYVRDPERSGRTDGEVLGTTDFGFHDRHDPLARRGPDRFVVLVMGGSVAEVFADQGASALAEGLKRLPALSAREIVLVRCGLGGYKQPQQLMLLNYLLALGGEYDLCLNLDGFNEVALHQSGNAKQGVFPIYPRDWLYRVKKISDPLLLPLVGQLAYHKAERVSWARTCRDGLWSRSATLSLIWRARDRWLAARIRESDQMLRELEPRQQSYVTTGPPLELADDEALYRHLVDIWRRSSLQMHALCQAHGVRYVHVLQPNQYLAGSKPMSADERAIAILATSPYRAPVEQAYPMLQRAGQELIARGVTFLDMTGVFAEIAEPLYIDSCCHFNERGNQILARAVAAELTGTWDAEDR